MPKFKQMEYRRDQMYRVRGQFIAYACTIRGGTDISRNKLRRGRDTSGPYDISLHED